MGYIISFLQDSGGFSRIDLSGRPKYTIVDIVEEEKKMKARAEALAEEERKAALNNNPITADVDDVLPEFDQTSVVANADNEYMDRDPDSFFGAGPVMM